MNKRLFNKLQKQRLEELKDSKLGKAWWKEGPRYTLQFHVASGDRIGRVYRASATRKGKIPNTAYYEDKKYVLDLKSVKEADFPLHFVPYVIYE